MKRRPAKSKRRPLLWAEITLFVHAPGAADHARFKIGSAPPGRLSADQEFSRAARKLARLSRTEATARLLDALAHPQRIQLLLSLLAGQSNHKKLAAVTNLKAGPLYHHLRELRMAEFIGPKERDEYSITRKGRRAILAAITLEKACR
jgi:predicted transcriptional regulator